MKLSRINRLFNPKSGKCFDVAIDHGFFNEYTFLQGIENIESSVKTLIDANPDAISQAELVDWVDAGTIEFLGKLPDVRPAFANSSVYVLPSYREGTPRTVLEAMAMGRAVITTDAPGCRETVVDGFNGFLVPVRDVSALEGAMKKMIENPEVVASMGARSRQIAEEKYDVHQVNAVMLGEMGLR